MNRLFIVAVLTVTMTVMMATAGFALSDPHNLSCDNCHGKFLGDSFVDPANANNACVTCHSSNGEASRMPVNTGDMANYFGHVSGQPATGSRSTHTWGASTTSPQANVQEPAVLKLGYSNVPLANTVLCIRCHDVKNGNNVLNVTKPFLRATNVNDALCLTCHSARQTTTSTTGSHPVAYRAYSTVYKSNTTAFRRKPLAGNTNNASSNPGNYLSSGKIVCSTCHAPHYADSSSASYGNRSTANGSGQDDAAKGIKGQLQNSKGTLLRTDPIASSATAINACSSCHKETANSNHNGKGQNVQCDHCHGAHVDYTGDGSSPNLHLVRRDFSGMSTAKVKLGANVKVLYNSATSLRFKRADSKGICQVCHTPTPGVAIHDVADTKAADCIVCHKHSNGFSAADCTSCHGQPPVTSLVGGPNGKASSAYTLDEALTPHATHADKAYYNYACKNCHYDGTRQDSHNTATATFQSVFVETAGSVSEPYRKNTASDYNPVSRRCSGVYCHSNGSPRGALLAWKSYSTPSWQYGRNKILGTASECTTCHESGATLVTNAHFKHVSTNSMACNVCHAATVSNSGAIIDRTKHANGVKDIKFVTRPQNFFGVFSSSWNPTTATCNNSCHSNGFGGSPVSTPKWTDSATGACGQCHALDPDPGVKLHTFHFTDPVGPQLGAPTSLNATGICTSCHNFAVGAKTHANGSVDFKNATPCAPCHQGSTPSFIVGTKVTCESCHTGTASIVTNLLGNYTAPLKNSNATLGHGKYAMAAQCTNCHNGTAPHIGAAPTEKRLTASGNAVCTTCHVNAVMGIASTARANLLVHGGLVNPFNTYTSAANKTNIAAIRADACAGCHDTHGTTNLMSIRTVINGQTVTLTNTSSGFIAKTKTNGKYNGFCQVCHTKAKHFNNFTTPELSHMSSNGKNCLTCHTHKGGKFAFAPNGGAGCNGCHGYPPAKNMTGIGIMNNYTDAKLEYNAGAGGAHTVAGHIPKTAKQSQTWANCSNCHFNQGATHMNGGTPVKTQYVDVVVNPVYKFNSMSSIKYNAKTCSNVSCHFKPTPNWTTGL
ncbi:MAG: CxxxxCH/CxxCH domain-containing protein [Geobacteraceae bacterium]|nr:CxxxxCH/CxxCH domain-containing protein [Geobacteraceae bacterium]